MPLLSFLTLIMFLGTCCIDESRLSGLWATQDSLCRPRRYLQRILLAKGKGENRVLSRKHLRRDSVNFQYWAHFLQIENLLRLALSRGWPIALVLWQGWRPPCASVPKSAEVPALACRRDPKNSPLELFFCNTFGTAMPASR